MGKRQSIAEARNNLPTLVREAESGKPVELSRRGESVAVLISRNLRQLPAWAAGHRVLRWTAHFSWISLVLMDVVLFSTLPADGTFGPDVPIGWPNRLVVVAYALWLMAVARHAQQAARTTSAETQAATLSA